MVQNQSIFFISSLTENKKLLENLKIDGIIDFIKDEKKFIFFINPQDKKLIDVFIKKIPDIFESLLNNMTKYKQIKIDFFQEHQEVVNIYIKHILLEQKLVEKETNKTNKHKL